MDFIIESMTLPIDNLLGMLLYAILYMLSTGLIVGLSLRFIPNRIPYGIKNVILGFAVFLSLFIWWLTIIK
ncbi:hypothetical protein [Aquibacillus rhizosphaerae]|uniref:Uncharacterized protein n=1 Tax=Aquibacillus rhizosphaerae TaxID=3051431 RepID=A0ABT7L8Q7_9BACI|nr:hypothetical protein [Aquibacillus sp. LR5S19]MDL4842252.1 hypothetical protein [Aquibacillus sp. LR5S19]